MPNTSYKCIKCGNGTSSTSHPTIGNCSKGGGHDWVAKYLDLRKENIPGYPKTIYDDGKTKLEVWKFHKMSILTLLISNTLISESEVGVGASIKPLNGDKYMLSFDPPSKMSHEIRMALECEPYLTEDEGDILPTDEFLIIYLDPFAIDIWSQFDANGVLYNKEQYVQFTKDLCAEEEALNKEFYAVNATRPIHPNIAILQAKLDHLRAYIEEVEVNDDNENAYDDAVETLLVRVDNDFEEIEHYREEIPSSGGTEAEDDALLDIERRIKELEQRRRQKLDEIGYESPED